MRSLALVRRARRRDHGRGPGPFAVDAAEGTPTTTTSTSRTRPGRRAGPGPVHRPSLAGVIAAIAMSIGWSTRIAHRARRRARRLPPAPSTTHVHNNRALPLRGAPDPVDQSRRKRARRWILASDASGRPAVEAPAGRLAAALRTCRPCTRRPGSASCSPDWFGGTVTWGRVAAEQAMVSNSTVRSSSTDVLLNRSFHIARGEGDRLHRAVHRDRIGGTRTHRSAVAAAVVFHVMIELSAEVQVFSYLGIAGARRVGRPVDPWDHVECCRIDDGAAPTPWSRHERVRPANGRSDRRHAWRGAPHVRVRAPPSACPNLTPATWQAAATSAADWLIDNQEPDGRSLLRVRPGARSGHRRLQRRPARRRHVVAVPGGPGIDGRPRRRPGPRMGTGNVVERGTGQASPPVTRSRRGTMRRCSRHSCERRRARVRPSYDAFMEQLARFIDDQVEPSGLLALLNLGPTGAPRDVLDPLHAVRPTRRSVDCIASTRLRLGATADRMGDYMARFVTTSRDLATTRRPLVGVRARRTRRVPGARRREPLTDAEVGVRPTTRRASIGQRARSISQRFGPWGSPSAARSRRRGGGYGVFGEGLAGTWRAAELDDRLVDERAPLGERALCISGSRSTQVDAAEAAEYPNPCGRSRGPGSSTT